MHDGMVETQTFGFDVPSGWQVMPPGDVETAVKENEDHPPEHSRIEVIIASTDRRHQVVVMVTPDVTEGPTMDDIVAAARDQADVVGGGTQTGVQAVKGFGSAPAAFYDSFSYEDGGARVGHRWGHFVQDGNGYAVVASGPADDVLPSLWAWDHVRTTWRFTPTG